MIEAALIFLIAVLTGGYALIQRQRERDLAQRLRNVKDPTLASLEVDAAIHQSRQEADALGRMRDHTWP